MTDIIVLELKLASWISHPDGHDDNSVQQTKGHHTAVFLFCASTELLDFVHRLDPRLLHPTYSNTAYLGLGYPRLNA